MSFSHSPLAIACRLLQDQRWHVEPADELSGYMFIAQHGSDSALRLLLGEAGNRLRLEGRGYSRLPDLNEELPDMVDIAAGVRGLLADAPADLRGFAGGMLQLWLANGDLHPADDDDRYLIWAHGRLRALEVVGLTNARATGIARLAFVPDENEVRTIAVSEPLTNNIARVADALNCLIRDTIALIELHDRLLMDSSAEFFALLRADEGIG